MELTSPSVIRALMSEAGITFRKEFGQNFLINRDVVERIADAAAESPDTLVLEIGPGIGTLTQKLCERYARVVAIEIDRGLIPILGRTLSDYDNVTVIEGDVMKVDLARIIAEQAGGRPVAVCANLPYYITTPILMRLLELGLPLTSITIMIQTEVAERFAAPAGSAEYGAITASSSYYAKIEKIFNVSPANFIPPPKVTSSVIRMNVYKTPPVNCENEENLFRVIRGAFAKRRKTLSNSLAGETSRHTKSQIENVLVSLGYRADVRGETLGLADFARISDALEL